MRCEVCGSELNNITWRHLKQHNMTVAEYKAQFPNAQLLSDEYLLKMKASATANNASRKGLPRSEETKAKIRASKKDAGQPAWNRGASRTPEQNTRQSQVMKAKFASGELTHWNTGRVTSEETKAKIRATALAQHRTMSSTSKQKRTLTYIAKEASGWIHYSKTDAWKTRVRETSKQRYGVEHWMQLGIPPEALDAMNDSTWLYEQHITLKKPITRICEELGLHWKNANGMIKRRLAQFDIEQQYHFSQSHPEREINELLRSWGFDTVTNSRNIIAPKELDIFVPSENIAIEYCGLIWHSSAFVHHKYHYDKMVACNERGIRLITIFEDEWIHRREQVVKKLAHIFNKATCSVVYARKCTMKEVPTREKTSFFEQYHIQGDGPSSIQFGLYDGSVLVAVAAFKQDSSDHYTLSRYASSCRVVGGCSKLMAHFIKTINPLKITTFADLRWSTLDANMYESTQSFVLDGIVDPDYSYVDTQLRLRIHKANFRRDALRRYMGDTFDVSLSERDNADRAGLHRIYNCGLARYVYAETTINRNE